MIRLARTLLLLGALVGSSCLTGRYTRVRYLSKPGGFQKLEVGESDLTHCLDTLGAPLIVSELREGAVLAWGWSKLRGWGAKVSVPLGRLNPSVEFSDATEGIEGYVLFFDEQWNLIEARKGWLREILPNDVTRPQLIEDEDDAGSGSDSDSGASESDAGGAEDDR